VKHAWNCGKTNAKEKIGRSETENIGKCETQKIGNLRICQRERRKVFSFFKAIVNPSKKLEVERVMENGK
jgi:hypothetical protein